MALTTAQLEQYHTAGWLHLPGLFSPDEVAAWHAEADRLLASDYVDEDNLRTRFRQTPDGERIVEKFDPVTSASQVYDSVARDERIVGPVRELFGEEPRLFKDKLIFKPAGAEGYGPHQDFTWWQPFQPEKLLSVMVAVDGADASNGALEVISDPHDEHYTPGELRGLRADELAARGLTNWQMVETQPGDILIFHCLVPHRSGRNTSDRSRRQFYPSYLGASAGDQYDAHYRHYREYVEANLSDEQKERLYLS